MTLDLTGDIFGARCASLSGAGRSGASGRSGYRRLDTSQRARNFGVGVAQTRNAKRRGQSLGRYRALEFSLKLEPLLQFLQIRFQFLDCLITLVNVLAQSLHYDPFEFRGRVRREPGQRRRIGLGYRNNNVGLGFAQEGRAARRHFIKHHTQTPNVSARIDRLASGLLGRHVLRSSEDDAGVSLDQGPGYGFGISLFLVGSFGELGEAEIQNFNVAVAPNHYVFRLDVAMDDTGGVGLFQRARHLDRDVQNLRQVHRRAAQTLSQSNAINKFRGNEVTSAFVPHFIDGENVWMVEGRSRIGFLIKAAEAIAILG